MIKGSFNNRWRHASEKNSLKIRKSFNLVKFGTSVKLRHWGRCPNQKIVLRWSSSVTFGWGFKVKLIFFIQKTSADHEVAHNFELTHCNLEFFWPKNIFWKFRYKGRLPKHLKKPPVAQIWLFSLKPPQIHSIIDLLSFVVWSKINRNYLIDILIDIWKLMNLDFGTLDHSGEYQLWQIITSIKHKWIRKLAESCLKFHPLISVLVQS